MQGFIKNPWISHYNLDVMIPLFIEYFYKMMVIIDLGPQKVTLNYRIEWTQIDEIT